MKKKLLLLTGALTVAALSVAIFAHKPLTAEEALLLANVEAIAQNEGSGGDGVPNLFLNCISGGVSTVVIPGGGSVSFMGITITGSSGSTKAVAWEVWSCVSGSSSCNASEGGTRVTSIN